MHLKKIGVLSCFLLLLAFVMAGGFSLVRDAYAQRALGPYMIQQHSNPNATAGVFRVNVNTGFVSYCYIEAGAKPVVSCTPEAQ